MASVADPGGATGAIAPPPFCTYFLYYSLKMVNVPVQWNPSIVATIGDETLAYIEGWPYIRG